jgi:hypothetical protein
LIHRAPERSTVDIEFLDVLDIGNVRFFVVRKRSDDQIPVLTGIGANRLWYRLRASV